MAMDEQLCQEEVHWFLQLRSGEEITLIPRANEPLWVTDVFLVDPESAASQGVVAACVEMGTRNIMLAQLSSEVTNVELQTPVQLDEEFCFYVMRGGDSDADTNTNTDADADAVVVQFEGFVLAPPSPDTEEGEEEEVGEEAASSEDDEDIIDDYEKDGESDGEVERNVAGASSAGGNAKDVLHFAARILVTLFLFGLLALL